MRLASSRYGWLAIIIRGAELVVFHYAASLITEG